MKLNWPELRAYIARDWEYFRRQEMAQEFREAIDEAEADPQVARAYVLGLCAGAAIARMPTEVWASPERHARQEPKEEQ